MVNEKPGQSALKYKTQFYVKILIELIFKTFKSKLNQYFPSKILF